jgi:hypothetical protein
MPAVEMKDSYDRAMAHLPRVWPHVMYLIENRAAMKGHLIICSLALVCLCMWTLDLFAAASSSPDSHASAPPRGIFTVSRYGVSVGPTAQGSEVDQRDLSALNLLV